MSSMETTNITIEKLKSMFSEGKRFDGRGLTDMRDLTIEKGVSNKAEGSVRVRLGKTEVLVGIKISLGAPYPDSPNEGNIMASGDFLPMASPRIEQGPPKYDAIELSRLVDRAIRESHMIDLSKLVVVPGEKVFTVFIDVYPINDDGAMIDAAVIGAVVALNNTIVPELNEDKSAIDYSKKGKTKLALTPGINPLSFSFFKLGDSIILDPTREEQEACEARITFGISEWNGQKMINSCQKYGETEFTSADMAKMMEILPKKFGEVSEKLKKFL